MARLSKHTPARPKPKIIVNTSHLTVTPEMVGRILDLTVTDYNDETGGDIYYTLRLSQDDIRKIVKVIRQWFPELLT